MKDTKKQFKEKLRQFNLEQKECLEDSNKCLNQITTEMLEKKVQVDKERLIEILERIKKNYQKSVFFSNEMYKKCCTREYQTN